MTSTLPGVVGAAFADSTNQKYSRAWNKWLQWSGSKTEVRSIPAEPFQVSLYLNSILRSNGKRGPILEAFYGIKWGHNISGFHSPTDHPFVQVVLEGCQRLCTTDKRKKKDVITPEMVKKLVDLYSSEDNIDNLRFLLLCLLGFTGFMRIDELLKLQLKDISVKETHLELFIKGSKTDQLREGNIIYISRLESIYCPVSIFEKFMKASHINVIDHPETFVIPRLFRSKNSWRISKTDGISYSRAREIFKDKIQPVNNEKKNLGLHSLRSGGASAAAQRGVPDRMISKHGRWMSERGRDGYILDSVKDRNRVSQSLGL